MESRQGHIGGGLETREKVHILFLGLDHRLLWQLTRTLAHLEGRVVVDCVKDPAEAKEICDQEPAHVIVADGWEQARQAARYLAGDEAFEGGAWKWIILVESLPLESLPAGRLSPSAVFLEKPFDPKRFPSFLLDVVESGRAAEEEGPSAPVAEEMPLHLTPGETYQEPAAGPPGGAGTGTERAPGAGEPAGPDPFHRHVDEGFARLSERDWQGAREHWLEALKIRPDDRRLRANLRRLEKIVSRNG